MLPYGRKNPLPFPISKRSPVSDLRQMNKQKEVGVKRVETIGVYPLAPPRGATPFPLSVDGKIPARKGRSTLRKLRAE